MRIFVQRPYLNIHSNYDEIQSIRVRNLDTKINVEIWAKCPDWLENGVIAELDIEQAENLAYQLTRALSIAKQRVNQ